MMPGTTTGDSGSGVMTAMTILAAYVQKLRTGEGQEIEVSMQEAITYFLRTRAFGKGAWGTQAAPRTGNRGVVAPVDLYPCKPFRPNDYIYLIPVNEDHWDALCSVIDRPDLVIDPRFETNVARMENAEALIEEISRWTSDHTKYEAMETIASAGVPCGACLDTYELYHDPHLQARGFVHELELPVHGKVPMLGFAPRLSASHVEMSAPPLLGEHTDEILTTELGLTEMRNSGDIGDKDRFIS